MNIKNKIFHIKNVLTKSLLMVFLFSLMTMIVYIPTPYNQPKIAYAATPPTFIQEVETSWTTNTSSVASVNTASFNVTAGDVLVATGITSDNAATLAIDDNTSTSANWINQKTVSVAAYDWVGTWTKIVTNTEAMTVTFSRTGSGAILYGGSVITFRGSDGVGASSKTNVLSGAPSLALTTLADNSAIVVANGDWSAADGASRTWRTVNSIIPTAANGLERTYFRDSSQYTNYIAYYNDAGTAGAKTTGLSAPGSQKYSITAVEIKGTAPAGITVSGTAYATDETTALITTSRTVNLRVNGTLAGTGDGGTGIDETNTSTGAWSFTGVTASAGDTITIYLNGETEKANTITITDGTTNATSVPLYDDHVVIRSDNSTTATTILDLIDYDSDQNNTDMLFDAEDAATDTLVTEDGNELHINTGDTFTPGGTITTSPSASASSVDGDVHIDGTGVLSMTTYALSVGGDFNNENNYVESSPQTTTFTATATGHIITDGGNNFDTVVFNGSGGGWSFADATTIDEDLTMTAGTLSGTNNITVNGGSVTGDGTINLTGGTFLVDTAGNFGGATAWTFSTLTFGNGSGTTTTTATGTGEVTVSGVLTIAASQTLNAKERTWTLSGTTGTPFVITGTFNDSTDTSTFAFTGNNGAGNTTIPTSTAYNHVTVNNASEIYALAGTTTFGGNLTITAGTLTMGNFALTVTGTSSITGTLNTATGATGTRTFTGAVTINSGGTWDLSGQNPVTSFGAGITQSSSTLMNNGSGATTLIGNLAGAGTGGITFGGALTISSGTTSNGYTGGTVTTTGTLTLTGNWTQANGSILSLGSTTPFAGAGTFSASTATNTVNYTAAAATIKDPNGGTLHTYYHLGLSGSGAKTMTSITTISGNLTMSGSASTSGNVLTSVGGNLDLSSTANMTTGANLVVTGTVTVGDGTTLTLGAFTFSVTGITTIGNGASGIFTGTNGTGITLNGNLILNAGATWTKMTSGTVVFSSGTTQTWTDNTSGQDLGAVQVSVASGWCNISSTVCNSSWLARRKITLNNSASAENLTDFPVLVQLTSSNIDFTKVKDAGADIRFVDADGTTGLSYEIEKWDEAGTSYIWVKVPQIDTASSTDYIYMYYNNTAVTDNQAVTSVWDSNFAQVWHLPNGTSLTANDSTSNAKNGTISGPTATTGQIDGGGIWGVASTDKITSALTAHNATRTYEIWAYRTGAGGSSLGRMFDKNVAGTQTELLYFDSGSDYNFSRNWTTQGQWSIETPSASVWHHIVVTYDSSLATNDPIIYLDGVTQTLVLNTNPTGTILTNADGYIVGNRANDNARNWAGSLDEFRISDSIRSADWIEADYLFTKDNTKYTYASEETSAASTLNLTTSVKATSLTINASQIFSHNGSNTLTLTANTSPITNNGTFTVSTGTVEFASSATTGTTIPTSITYYGLKVNKASNTFTAATGTLTVGGNLDVTAGTLDLITNDPTTTITGNTTIDGTLLASDSAGFSIGGNLTNNGTFTHNSGTLTLVPVGAGTTINGTSNTTFNNLTLTGANGAGKTLQFKNLNTYTFAGTFNVAGQSGNPLAISSTSGGSQWTTTFNGTITLAYITVKDSACSGGNSTSISESVLTRGNNGACWVFISFTGAAGGAGTPPVGGTGSGGGTPTSGGTGQTGGGSTDGSSGGGTPVGGGSVQSGGGEASP